MTRTSTGSAAIAASAATRVRCEHSVWLVGVLRLGPAGGPVVGFVPSAEENVMPVGNGRRVAVVAGCRKQFCRAGTALKDVRAVDLARGVEALSDIPILASRRLADILVEASKAKSLAARVRAFSRIRPRDLVPVSPAIAEPSTGETMGQSAEKMAKENHISREAQDRWALRSHRLAAQGTDDHRLTAEIIPWFPA